jgi:methylmalonyl-CoA mutase cobalamin-binding domain/chain
MTDLKEISVALQKGRAKEVKELVEQAVADGISAKQILDEGLLDGMNIVGQKFKVNELYVPDVLVAARAMNAGTAILKPLLVEDGVEATGKVVIGTCKGDLHDIGKNLVKMMMEGKGLEVIDLGVDVSAEKFVNSAIESDADIIACSALLTTTMGEMANVVKLADEKGVRDKFTIMVGGAPVNESFKDSVGADIYAPDAASAADEAVASIK